MNAEPSKMAMSLIRESEQNKLILNSTATLHSESVTSKHSHEVGLRSISLITLIIQRDIKQ